MRFLRGNKFSFHSLWQEPLSILCGVMDWKEDEVANQEAGRGMWGSIEGRLPQGSRQR